MLFNNNRHSVTEIVFLFLSRIRERRNFAVKTIYWIFKGYLIIDQFYFRRSFFYIKTYYRKSYWLHRLVQFIKYSILNSKRFKYREIVLLKFLALLIRDIEYIIFKKIMFTIWWCKMLTYFCCKKIPNLWIHTYSFIWKEYHNKRTRYRTSIK